MRRPLLALVFAAVSLASVSPARAEPSLSDRETARSLMDDGDAKRDKGDFRLALKSYEAADAIMHVPTTGLEVARVQAQLGMLLEARETLGRVARLPPKPGEPAAFTAARKTAESLSAEIGARIPSVTVLVTNGDPTQPTQLVFDGDAVPPAAAQAPRKVNPGQHTIVARSGVLEKKEDFTVNERETRTVTLDLKPPPVVEVKPVEPPRASSLPKILMFGGFGVGAVGVGIGAVTGLISISKVSDVRKDCIGDVCKQGRQGDINSARSLGTISTIAFVAGGVGIGAGVVGIILSGRQAKEPSPTAAKAATLTFVPDVGPTWLGAHGTF